MLGGLIDLGDRVVVTIEGRSEVRSNAVVPWCTRERSIL
jgi:hypothetical protein